MNKINLNNLLFKLLLNLKMSYNEFDTLEMFQKKFNSGYSLYNVDDINNSALHIYINSKEDDRLSIIEFIIETHFDLDTQNDNGDTALHLLKQEDCSLARLFLRNYANPIIPNKKNITFFDKYYKWDYIFIEYLKNDVIDALKEMNIQDKRGNTLLHKYCGVFSHIPILKTLIDNGFDPNIKNNEGNLPLHLEVFDINTYKHMIDKIKDINTINNKGETILHSLYKQNIDFLRKKELTKLLLDKGLDFNLRDLKGKRAIYYLSYIDRLRLRL